MSFAKIFRIHMRGTEVFLFGDFMLDTAERRLQRGSEALHLAPKALDLLVALVRDHGRLVTKQQLLARVWPNVFVDEGILTVHVSALRKVLDHGSSAEWIQTVPREGYRFTGRVLCRTGASRGEVQVATPVEAQELLRAGRAHLLAGSSSEMPAALAAFGAMLRIDATCAPAHAGLALTRCVQANLRAVPHVDAYAEAKVGALRALAMDSDCADAQAALGAVLFWSEWDWTAAAHSLERALASEPDHCEALLHYGALHDALGRRETGLRLKQMALTRAPHSPLVLMEIAVSYYLQGRYDEAIEWARKALSIDPLNQRATEFINLACWVAGDVPGVIAEKRRRASALGLSGESLAALERGLDALHEVHTRSGRDGVARWLLQTLPSADDSHGAFQRAALHAASGETDNAFDCLDQALTLRDPHLVYLAVHSIWDPLRGDPRMSERLRRLGLPAPAGRD